MAFIAILCSACTPSANSPAPQADAGPQQKDSQAGQPVNPLTAAAKFATAEAALATGNHQVFQAQVHSMARDQMRAMKAADGSRPIDHEEARAAVHPLEGVRSVVWLDHANLLVAVGGSQYRNMEMIDRICAALDPLGDTLAVVVNVQDMTATTSEGAEYVSRNCQLQPGDHALGQANRKVDALDPATLRAFKAQQSKSGR